LLIGKLREILWQIRKRLSDKILLNLVYKMSVDEDWTYESKDNHG
jgi:hypothetical protein